MVIDGLENSVSIYTKPSLIQGHCWGKDVTPLLASLPPSHPRFDTLILSDLVFNHSQHRHLLKSCLSTSAPTSELLVFYTHHRPRHAENDLNFFNLAREEGWECEEVVEEWTGVMFGADAHLGEEKMRGTVHGWRCWRRKEGDEGTTK